MSVPTFFHACMQVAGNVAEILGKEPEVETAVYVSEVCSMADINDTINACTVTDCTQSRLY